MMSGIGASSQYGSLYSGQQKPAGMKGGPPQGAQRPGSGERFKQIDTDGNGGVDKSEFQVLADKISGVTGKEINVEELTKSHDANGDGLLGQDEMQAMMMELRPQGQGGPPTQQALSAYQVQSDKDLSSTLIDMLDETEEDDEKETSSINTNA
jgi:Ca2+-binding EF-hand superfamily protein